ncbi:MAG TPA: hypothetical protein VKQ36_07275, partial [Ktedonobacterales bacterium]|nr:hypothetical protein [Ktedonobacterales bacterium]
ISRPKVIVVSALRPPPARIAEFHPEGMLVKPFPIDALLRLMERLLTTPSPMEEGEPESSEHAEEQS